jgi:mannose-6-phosphate isomerase-like protein (cupin superfamily)
MKRAARIVTFKQAVKGMTKLNREIRYKSIIEARRFSLGLIVFRPGSDRDPKQIRHSKKDVLCYILKGRGRLRVNGRRIALKAGTLCHIPKGTPHDFAAANNGDLVLFYTLIKTR